MVLFVLLMCCVGVFVVRVLVRCVVVALFCFRYVLLCWFQCVDEFCCCLSCLIL